MRNVRNQLVYAGGVIFVNYLYMIVFSNKIALTGKNVLKYLGAFTLLAGLFMLSLVTPGLLGPMFVLVNLLLMYQFTRNQLITVLFSLFTYSMYHIIWFVTFYKYYRSLRVPMAYPFLDLDTTHFFLLFFQMLSFHLLIFGLTAYFMRKYEIYMILQHYQTFGKKRYLYLLFFVFLFVISFLLFYLWEKDQFTIILTLLLLACSVSLLFSVLVIFFITKNKLLNDRLVTEITHGLNLEQENDKVQLFKHDYRNILMTLEIFIENDDMEGLKKYYYQYLQRSKEELKREKVYIDLRNIQILPLRGLVENKVQMASEKNIPITVTIPEPVTQLSVPLIDLVRCLGILLDNALEESFQVADPKIEVSIHQGANTLEIVVSNKVQSQKNLVVEKFIGENFSTKGAGRGKGLYSLNKLVDSWGKGYIDLYVEEGYFYGRLMINN